MHNLMALFDSCCLWRNQFHHSSKMKLPLYRKYTRYSKNADISLFSMFLAR